ncbi:major facilitator superfamily membrane protein [Planoprotostelium fungivorum]|uniref:Major facilitator superfamily membrane protein n=1 Tax=Planoprotostelium fungivorum TaxID=1890364 RepID=A0A2P6NYR2_9EUKA|nr:major facilitator superfamily membrane protein [Planoprotostelium fungivorum]
MGVHQVPLLGGEDLLLTPQEKKEISGVINNAWIRMKVIMPIFFILSAGAVVGLLLAGLFTKKREFYFYIPGPSLGVLIYGLFIFLHSRRANKLQQDTDEMFEEKFIGAWKFERESWKTFVKYTFDRDMKDLRGVICFAAVAMTAATVVTLFTWLPLTGVMLVMCSLMVILFVYPRFRRYQPTYHCCVLSRGAIYTLGQLYVLQPAASLVDSMIYNLLSITLEEKDIYGLKMKVLRIELKTTFQNEVRETIEIPVPEALTQAVDKWMCDLAEGFTVEVSNATSSRTFVKDVAILKTPKQTTASSKNLMRSASCNLSHTTEPIEKTARMSGAEVSERDLLIPKRSAPLWKILLIVIGGTLMAITGGSTNALSATYKSQIVQNLGFSSTEDSLLAGFSVLGLYFALPAGLILKHFGPFVLGLTSFFLAVFGYSFVTFLSAPWLVILMYILIGFGVGGIFMAALGVSINISSTGGGWTISVVSCGMSLSVAFHVAALKLFKQVSQCNADECWRQYVRFYLVLLVCIALPGCLILYLYKLSDYSHLTEEVDEHGSIQEERVKEKKGDTLLQSLKVFKSPFFLSLFLGYFAGVGSSIFILTQTFDIYDEYIPLSARGSVDSSIVDIESWIILIFSFCNAFGNLTAGVLSDYLASRKIVSYSTFLSVVQAVFSVVFVVLGVILAHWKNTMLFPLLLAFTGFGFGCYLVIFPSVTAEAYGAQNFGQYFAHLQISSSVASVVTPIIVSQVNKASGSFQWSFFGCAALLMVSAIGMFIGRLTSKR